MFTGLYLFQRNYKLIVIDLSKQQKLDADTTAIQPINFTGIQNEITIRKYFSSLKKEKSNFRFFKKNNSSIMISFLKIKTK